MREVGAQLLLARHVHQCAHRIVERRLAGLVLDGHVEASTAVPLEHRREADQSAAAYRAAGDALPGDDGVRHVLRDDGVPLHHLARGREHLPVRATVLVVDHPMKAADETREVLEVAAEGEYLIHRPVYREGDAEVNRPPMRTETYQRAPERAGDATR